MPETTSPSPWSDPDVVKRYLANVRGAVPLGIEQIEMALGLIREARPGVRTFLAIGCGDALLASVMLEEHPSAVGVLVDDAEAMLELARRRLHEHRERIEFVCADVHRPDWLEALANRGPFDVVVTAFALSAAEDARKREVFCEIFELLVPEGVFLNFEHVSSTTRWTQTAADDYLIDAIFGESIKRSPGKTRADVAHEYYERASRIGAATAPLEVQCKWLREIGFESVECFLKVQELALFGGQRGGAKGMENGDL